MYTIRKGKLCQLNYDPPQLQKSYHVNRCALRIKCKMIMPVLQTRKWEPEEVRDLPKAITLLSREQGLDLESRVFRRHGQGRSSVAGVKGRSRSSQRIGSEIRI